MARPRQNTQITTKSGPAKLDQVKMNSNGKGLVVSKNFPSVAKALASALWDGDDVSLLEHGARGFLRAESIFEEARGVLKERIFGQHSCREASCLCRIATLTYFETSFKLLINLKKHRL